MSEWKDLPGYWDEGCLVCGSSVEVKTDREDLTKLYEDDEVRCADEECHCRAQVILTDGEDRYIANLHWKEGTSKRFKN